MSDTVIATLLVLIASVVLGAAVIFFGGTMFTPTEPFGDKLQITDEIMTNTTGLQRTGKVFVVK